MPPGPAFNWLAVAHSALVILDHALQHKTAQVTRVGGIRISQCQKRTRDPYKSDRREKDEEELVTPTDESPTQGLTHVRPSSLLHANEAWLRQLEVAATPLASMLETILEQQSRDKRTEASEPLEPNSTLSTLPTTAKARSHAADPLDPLVLAADIELSGLDVSSPQDPQVPELQASPHDVLLDPHLRNRDI
jgi:hypothetical protein